MRALALVIAFCGSDEFFSNQSRTGRHFLSPFQGWITPRYYSGLAPWAATFRRFAACSPRLRSGGGKLARPQSREAAVGCRLDRPAKRAVVFVVEGDEAEGLQYTALAFAHGVQHFGHAVHVAGVGLESDFDEVSLRELPRQLQQASGDRNHVNVRFGLLSVPQLDECRGGCELNARSAMR